MVKNGQKNKRGTSQSHDQDLQNLADMILSQKNTSPFLSLLDALPIGITIQDLFGRIKYANNTAARFHGFSMEEFLRPVINREDIIAAIDHEKLAKAISNIPQSKYIHDLQIRGKKKDGSEFLLEINAQHILDSDKNPFGVLILTRDISKQLEIQQAEEKERKLSSALISSTALLSSTLNLDDVLEKILELAYQVVPHDSANIMLIDDQEVHVVRARGYKTQELHNFTMSVSTRVEDFPSMVQMIKNGLPMVITDTQKYPGWQTSPGFAWIHSYLGAPLRVKGQVIGVINLDSGQSGYYCEEDAPRLQAFADLAASAIANANLYEALQEKAAEATALFKAATGLLSVGGDVVALSRQITKTVHQDFSTAHVAILLINEATGKLEQIAQAGYPSEQTHPLELNDNTGLAAAAIRKRQPIYVEDVKEDPRFICDSPITQSEYDIPFIIGKKVIGVLNLESPEINGFNEHSRKVMLTFAERAAAALENARLIERLQKREFQMTLINQLTQISLKTSNFKEMLEKQVKILFNALSPDGVFICFSHNTIRKITDGYALTKNEDTNRVLNEIIRKPELTQRMAGAADVVISDDSIHQAFNDHEVNNPFKAYILHPLTADGIHFGSAILGYYAPKSFDKSEISFFKQVIDQLALSIAKSLSIILANDRAKEAENLRVASSTLTSTLNLQEVFERILQTAVGAIPSAENGLLFLYNEKSHIFQVRAQFGFSDPNIFTIRIGGHDGMAGLVAIEKKARIFDDISKEKIANFSKEKQSLIKQKCWIVAPLIRQDKVVGVIELCAAEANSFNSSDLNTLVSFADTVTAAIQNAQLHSEVQQIAITDVLTGLFNRRGFEELGQREIHRSLRTSAPLSMLLVDVDFLKQVNDEYGHSAGDKVIQEVAECCRSTFRQIDLVSRYGGDEFAILLPDTPIDHAREAAERLRQTIAKHRVKIREIEIQLSASIGVASFTKDLQTISRLFDLADKALYKAKQSGRNSIA